MPRYELSEGTSNKFWEVTVNGNDVITHYGRIGSAVQSTTKSFSSPAEAQAARDKLIAEKTKKGYVLKGPGAAPAPAGKVAVDKSHSSTPSFEDHIYER